MPVDANGTWLPWILTDLTANQNASWQAYLAYMRMCDQKGGEKSTFGLVRALALCFCYSVGTIVLLATLPATWCLAKKPTGAVYMVLMYTVSYLVQT